MKSRQVISVMLLSLLLMLSLSMGAAAGAPPGTWISGIQVQNLDPSNDATITLTFYWAVGTADAGQIAHTMTATVPANKMVNFHVPNITALPSNFIGSVVISSDLPIAATLITTNDSKGTATDPKRVGATAGISNASTTVYTPFLRKNYYGRNSYIAVQNTTSTATTVNVKYIDHNGAEVTTDSAEVPAYSTKIFYQNDNAALPNGFHGSSIITASQPIAVLVNDANSGGTAKEAGFESYTGFNSGSTKLYLPKLTVNYYDYQSGFQIQNVGTQPATMTITYNFNGITATRSSPVIQPGQAWSAFLANKPASGLPESMNGSGSAVVTSAQPMVAVVSERNDVYGFEVISAGVADGSGTSVVLFPKFDSQYYDYDGGIQIQNIGNAPTTLTAVFSMQGRPDVIKTSPEIAPGASYKWHGPDQGLGANFVGAVVVTSSGQPIAGVYTSRNTVMSGDTYSAYNGINK